MAGIKQSDFTVKQSIESGASIPFFENGTNLSIGWDDFITSLGVTGKLTSIGDPLAPPVIIKDGINFKYRAMEAGSGIKTGLSPQSGILFSHNFSQDGVGVTITEDMTLDSPIFSSLIQGLGISITKSGNQITFTNTVDPATGLSNRVVVTEASHLAGILDSTKEYFIDGIIAMGSQSIEIPAGGLNLTGYNFGVSKLTSNQAAYTMFTSPVGGSGDLLGKDYAIEVTGSGSQVYNITSATGLDAFEFARINYIDCESLGSITNYRQGLEVGTGRFGGKPQLELIGTWSGGYFIDTSIVRSLNDGAYSLFKAGAGFSMASRFRSNQNIDLPASVSFLDFAPGNFINPSTLQLDGCLISRNGVFDAADTNILPNVSPGDLISQWTGNNGIRNTFVGGQNTISTEVLTVISSIGAYVDLLGTFTTSDTQHFDSPSNGQLRHLGTSPQEYKLNGQIVMDGSNGDTVAIKVVIFRSATTSFEDGKIISRVIDNLQGGSRDVAYFVVIDNIILSQNDYVKLQVANTSGTDNVTAELDSFFIVEAR